MSVPSMAPRAVLYAGANMPSPWCDNTCLSCGLDAADYTQRDRLVLVLDVHIDLGHWSTGSVLIINVPLAHVYYHDICG